MLQHIALLIKMAWWSVLLLAKSDRSALVEMDIPMRIFLKFEESSAIDVPTAIFHFIKLGISIT